MSEIVVRRYQADLSRTASEVVLAATDRWHAAASLREVLGGMQRDRGQGLWSDSDPEVLVDGAVVGRMRRQEAIEDLVDYVVERACRSDARGGTAPGSAHSGALGTSTSSRSSIR